MTDTDSNNTVNDKNNSLYEQPLDTFLERSYRRYAILTILDRALPDARDGLKPVQRRILYAMFNTGMLSSSPHRKSARVVGEVLGKYHPHGDASVYDAMVRLAQDFTMRDPLIDGQGNFGSIDGDSAAAMRYTEARLTSVGESLLADIEKETVAWKPNFDGSLQEPMVLPTRFPNLLVNGSTGIAVGMSTNILPHNLGEVCNAVIHMANQWSKKEKITVDDLMKFIPGPDLPTGGLIYRYRVDEDGTKTDVLRQAYETGNATIACQAKAEIKEIGGGKSEICVTELPYQVQKSTILERIATHKDKFPGISDARDESDFNGMRVVFEVSRGADPNDVFQKLLTHTQMRNSLSHNALALIQQTNGNGSGNGHAIPSYLSLSQMLQEFIKHRLEVITKRSQYELNHAEARLHIVKGLLKALSMIDEVIDIIRKSQTTDTARTNLMKKLDLSQIQAQAILDMPLRRLASLERKKLEEEAKELEQTVKRLKALLDSEKLRLEILIAETNEIKEKFASPRRTIILDSEEGHQAAVTVADLVIPQEQQICILSSEGLERMNSKEFRESVTAGKVSSRATKIIYQKLTVEPDESVIMVTNLGRAWIGQIGKIAQKAIDSELGLKKNERLLSINVMKLEKYLVLVTKQGNVKRLKSEDCTSALTEASWGTLIGLSGEDDEVLAAAIVDDSAQIIITTKGSAKSDPRVLRFASNTVNPQATPSARGVTAIKMLDDSLVSCMILDDPSAKESALVFLTEKGQIKQVGMEEFPVQGRGGQGVLCYKCTSASGYITGSTFVQKGKSVDVISMKGKRLRLSLKDIPLTNRPGKGIDLAAKFGNGKDLFPEDQASGIIAI